MKLGSKYKPTFGNVAKDVGLTWANTATLGIAGQFYDEQDIQNPFLDKINEKVIPAYGQIAANVGGMALGVPGLGNAVGGLQNVSNNQTADTLMNEPKLALGGTIQSYQGLPKHANGGVMVDQLGNPSAQSNAKGIAEVEGGEYSHNGYVFSNQLSEGKKQPTFAEQFKGLAKKYGYDFKNKKFKRDSDPITKGEFEQMANQLRNKQDALKLSKGLAHVMPDGSVMDGAPMMAKGGTIPPYNPGQLHSTAQNTNNNLTQFEQDKLNPGSYINKATGAVELSPINIEDAILLPYAGYKVGKALSNLNLAKTPKYIGNINIGSHPKTITKSEGVYNAAKGYLGAQATTTALDTYKNGGLLQMAKGGIIPPYLLKEQNPYLVPEYNQPMVGSNILPDPNRPKVLGTQMSEYKMGINMDGKDYSIPTVVGGQYLGAEGAIDRFRATGESFKNTANPQSYSKFYDEVDKIGIMKLANGGGILPTAQPYTNVSVDLSQVKPFINTGDFQTWYNTSSNERLQNPINYGSGAGYGKFGKQTTKAWNLAGNDYLTNKVQLGNPNYGTVNEIYPQSTFQPVDTPNQSNTISFPNYGSTVKGSNDFSRLDTGLTKSMDTQSFLGDLPTSAKVGMGVQALSGLANAAYAFSRKPNKATPQVYTPETVNYNPAVQAINEQAATARNMNLDLARRTGTLSGFMNVGRAGLSDINRQTGAAASNILAQEANINTQARNQAQLANLQERARVQELNFQEKDAIDSLRMNAIGNLGTLGSSMSRDVLAYQSEAEKAKYLGSPNFRNFKINGVNTKGSLSNRTTTKGLPVYILQDGEYVDSFGNVLTEKDLAALESKNPPLTIKKGKLNLTPKLSK